MNIFQQAEIVSANTMSIESLRNIDIAKMSDVNLLAIYRMIAPVRYDFIKACNDLTFNDIEDLRGLIMNALN